MGRLGSAGVGGSAAEMPKLVAWAVHLLTASGAALAFLAAIAAARGAWTTVFLCLGIALVVDGLDGPLARRIHVKERIPWFDGAALDFVVDYATYVFVPAVVLASNGLMSEPLATVMGILVAVVGALYFADKRMKTPDQAFRGFPAVWNGLVYLLAIYRLPELVTAAIVVAAAVLTFSPIEFIHPVRVKRLRPLTLLVTLFWAILAFLALAADLRPGPFVSVALAAASLYLAGIGAFLQATREEFGP